MTDPRTFNGAKILQADGGLKAIFFAAREYPSFFPAPLTGSKYVTDDSD